MGEKENQSGRLRFDHVVIVVKNLKKAISNFESLGFQVMPGGDTGPVSNALIILKDGTYIELITMRSKLTRGILKVLYYTEILTLLNKLKPSLKLRFCFWFSGSEGLRDWCVACDSLNKSTSGPFQQGSFTAIEDFARTRFDGVVVRWLLSAPVDRSLPFIIEDITERTLRVPVDDSLQHPNGVQRISSISYQGELPMTIKGINCKASDSKEGPRLKIELESNGTLKGLLDLKLTSNAHIEIV